RAHRCDGTRRHADFREHAARGRGHFHRNLVGLDLEQIVARLHGIAGRDEPLRDLALSHGLAELRHQDVHASPPDAYQLTEMYCVSMNSKSPSCAPSRPMPDCFMPPNGAAGSDTSPRFKPIMPKSSFSDTRMPRLKSLV